MDVASTNEVSLHEQSIGEVLSEISKNSGNKRGKDKRRNKKGKDKDKDKDKDKEREIISKNISILGEYRGEDREIKSD